MILNLNNDYKGYIKQAAEVIRNGGLVAFPTETVYGLGANTLDESAVARIFEAKGRPQDNPLIVHVDSIPEAQRLAQFNDNAQRLADAFWPGPITLVLKCCAPLGGVTAGLETVGVRMPDNDGALSLISASGVPIAAPSANKSGSPSPTCAAHVAADFGEDLMILDAGECGVGVESTVIDVSGENPVILRPGAVTQPMIEEILGREIACVAAFSPSDIQKPMAPGMKYRHYAPKAAVTVVEGDNISVAEAIKYLYDKDIKKSNKPLIIASRENKKYYGRRGVAVSGSIHNLSEAAQSLYGLLRDADADGYTQIFFEAIPKDGIGFAVMNRIYKAAAYNTVKV